jgi:hypothetical protein
MAFLLVWDKDGYKGSLLVLFPCISILEPQLVHLFQASSLLPSALPMVAPNSLGFPYSFLHSEHINHIQVFCFPHLPYPSSEWPPLSVTHVPEYCCSCFKSLICIWGRTCSFWPCEDVPSIYLWITEFHSSLWRSFVVTSSAINTGVQVPLL